MDSTILIATQPGNITILINSNVRWVHIYPEMYSYLSALCKWCMCVEHFDTYNIQIYKIITQIAVLRLMQLKI